MKRFIAVAFLLAVSASFSTCWQGATQSPSPAPTVPAATAASSSQPDSQLGLNGPVRAEDVFKNIETFKGKPATQVLLAMNAIRGSLGVSCTYCHAQFE